MVLASILAAFQAKKITSDTLCIVLMKSSSYYKFLTPLAILKRQRFDKTFILYRNGQDCVRLFSVRILSVL